MLLFSVPVASIDLADTVEFTASVVVKDVISYPSSASMVTTAPLALAEIPVIPFKAPARLVAVAHAEAIQVVVCDL